MTTFHTGTEISTQISIGSAESISGKYSRLQQGLHAVWGRIATLATIPQSPESHGGASIAQLDRGIADFYGLGGYQAKAQPETLTALEQNDAGKHRADRPVDTVIGAPRHLADIGLPPSNPAT